MTITAYGTGTLQVQNAVSTFTGIKADLATFESQVSTGKVGTTYAQLGAAASTSLVVQSQLSANASYSSNVSDAQLRITMLNAGLGQVGKLASGLATGLPTSLGTSVGATGATVSAADGLEQMIDVLNTNVNGRYLFAGRASDTQPVASYDLIINGDASHAGLKTLVSQRQAADLGADGLGRLTLASTGSTTTLSESAAGLPFGFKILSASSTGTAIGTTVSSTPPASVAFAVNSQPAAGDTVSVSLTLPDGTQQAVTLAAGTGNSADGFAIGATTADTAANLSAALGFAVKAVASGPLAASSAYAAATDFFSATPSNPPQRVYGTTPETATAFVSGTAADTVTWYAGDTSASPRDSSTVRISDNQTVGLGVQGTEPAFRTILAGYGALAAQTFTSGSTTSQANYSALVGQIQTGLASANGTTALDNLNSDLATASKSLGDASSRLATTKNQLQDVLSDVEDANPTEAATKLLATQTRLQASYQVTSSLLKLSLTDYL